MGVYKVERKVDTVIIEVDISVGEQLLELLGLVQDNTRRAFSYQGSYIEDLVARLKEEVRYPSPLYEAKARGSHGPGYVELVDRF